MLYIGIIIGIVMTSIFFCSLFFKKLVGNLNVDRSDPSEQPYLFLEIYKRVGVANVINKKYVIMKVKHENYISHD